MLSKRFYNILTIIFVIVLAIEVFVLFYYGTIMVGEETIGSFMTLSVIFNILAYIIFGGYYILILILAIQLYAKEKLSLVNVVFVAIFMPLAIFFYLFTLKKILKEYEGLNIANVQQDYTQIQTCTQ